MSNTKSFFLVVSAFEPQSFRTQEQLVAAVADGHAEQIEHIFHITPADNRCEDVTEDTARAVYKHLHRENRAPSDQLAQWIDNHISASVHDEQGWNSLMAAE
jgi:hypothetical protein